MSTIDEILSRRVDKILPNKEGLKALMKTKKIRLYQGFDATGGKLHLGHSVGIRKLMDFANAGHEVIFLFGTGTVLVGDPSQRDTGRKLITLEEVEENIEGWKKQVSPLVDFNKVKILKNGDWLTKLKLQDLITIASNISAVQLFKREMFQRRLDRGDTVWYHETMYPLLQGYDSVEMDVDLEIGGTDQEFNMLVGRELMKKMKNKNKYILTTPMIMGIDGNQMSKSTGNCVWLDDLPNDMYGKLLSIPDTQIITYMTLATDLSMEEIGETEKNLQNDSINPLDAKKRLADAVVTQLHSKSDANIAREHFESTFQKGKLPKETLVIEVDDKINIIDAVAKVTGSRSVAKRLLSQNALDKNGVVVTTPNEQLLNGDILKIGKKDFVRVVKK
jgi:tyrosyl-tRNA synthetase